MPRPFPALSVALSLVFPVLAFLVPSDSSLRAGPIEAVQGKRYSLTKQHGPWTILVASFQDVPKQRVEVVDGRPTMVPNEEYVEGKSAYEAADELVHELRTYGVPAYTFEQRAEFDEAQTLDRLQRARTRKYTSKKRNIAVLAGNYPSAKDDAAQQTLLLVKRFRPQFLTAGGAREAFTTHSAGGAAFRPTPGQPSPLSGAFLTLNPLLTPLEARRMSGRGNPLAARLNTGNEFNLAQKQGKFTIQVATFQGKSTSHAFGARPSESFFESDGTSLDEAARNAWKVANRMRELGTEAYVHHEQFQSIVTVGTFDSPEDPRIPGILQFFAPKPMKHPQSNATMLQPEYLQLPPNHAGGVGEIFVMDPRPALIPVPEF